MKCRFTLVTVIVFFCGLLLNAQSWKTYPYHQTGSVLNFPRDEGHHPGEIVEWWYTNAHVTGDSTGTNYALMLTYFYYPVAIFDGFRIFELSNENTGAFLTETAPCTYSTIDTSHLHIMANTGLNGSGHEEWKTQDSSGILKPFQYHLNAAMPNGALNLTYNCVRRPLMVGGTGFLYEGVTGYTYYYSQTELQVSGTITMNGVTENVHGIAWIDRQWGQFNPNNGEKYTWMSLQLSNGMGLNLWNIFNTANQIPDTSTYRFCTVYENDSTTSLVNNFTLERLKFQFTSDNQKCYDQKWRLTYGNVDLILTATQISNEVQLPFRFFEGSMDITGTVGGTPVTGAGYVELLHSFTRPNFSITSPQGHSALTGTVPIAWSLNNPDDGRPVYYDVDFSTDNKATYTNIANHLTDTSYNWTPALFSGTEVWLRITGYSIDTTLAGIQISDTSFVYGASDILQLSNGASISVFPNPFGRQITIISNLNEPANVELEIVNTEGKTVKRYEKGYRSSGRHEFIWDATGAASGNYFYRFTANGQTYSGKFSKE